MTIHIEPQLRLSAEMTLGRLSTLMARFSVIDRRNDIIIGANGGSGRINLYSGKEREKLRIVRNRFAHGLTTIQDDGSIQIRDIEQDRVFDYALNDLYELEKMFSDFVNRLEILATSTVTCQTCGEEVDASQMLTCGHVEYKEGADENGAWLARKPKGGTLETNITFGKRHNNLQKDILKLK